MKKTALVIMLFTVLTKFLGFARDIVLSNYYGASSISDAYLIALTIPITIFTIIGAGITTSYIPMYNKIQVNKNIDDANKFTSNLINLLFIICTFIIMIVYFNTEIIVKIFASGFEGDILNLAISFTKLSILGIYFQSVIYVFTGFLQVKSQYIIPTVMGIPLNIVTILSIYISSKFNIIALPIGSVIALVCQFAFLVPHVYKRGYSHIMKLSTKDKYMKEVLTLAIPVIIGVSVNQINVIIDRTIASSIIEGGISALTYSNRLNLFVQGIFVTSIITVMYPGISKNFVDKKFEKFKSGIKEAVNIINILLIPITVGTLVFSYEIIRILFGRGAFNDDAVFLTSSALYFYSFGMIGIGLREVISRGFYAMQDTKTPMINASIGMIMNIILNIILSKYMGVSGLALATSISAIFTTVLLFISLRKKIGPLGVKQISISFLKILFASSIMGLLAKLSFNYLTTSLSQNLSLLLAIGVGVVSYFVIIYFMKIEDVDIIVGAIKKKLGRGAA